VTDVSTAYLKGDTIGVQGFSDPDRLPPTPHTRGAMNVGGVRVCGTWSSDKLMFATVNAVDPVTGQFFGVFEWESAASDDVVAEIGEFAYDEDARLFLVLPVQPGARQTISAGRLWTTRREWSWRIWSVSRTGELAFSEARTFVH
jgi:hypothetical protein